jgi:ATP-dependent DNA helicase RecQ
MLAGRYPSTEQLSRVYRALSEVEAGPTGVSTRDLETHLADVAKTKVRVALGVLKEEGIIDEPRAARWSLVDRDVSMDRLAELAQQWKERSESDHEKLKRMEAYARSALCRWRLLHEYFGEETPEERCGTCDNCRRGLARLAERPIASVEPRPKQNEIADTEAKLNIGDEVSLPRYGSGRVEEIDGDALVVSFPDGKNRKFKREFARPVLRSRQKI